MKVVLLNSAKVAGKLHRSGTVLEVPEAVGNDLIDREAAEPAYDIASDLAPKSKKKAPAKTEPGADDQSVKGILP